jgi:hypothetical protein
VRSWSLRYATDALLSNPVHRYTDPRPRITAPGHALGQRHRDRQLTSLSSPLWAGIAADMDSYAGGGGGFLNPAAISAGQHQPRKYSNDINGAGQMIKTDGLYPTTPGYDEATGLGSPQSAAAWYSSANFVCNV